MGFVDKVAFNNANASLFDVGQGKHHSLVEFKRVFVKLPKGCGLWVVGPGPYPTRNSSPKAHWGRSSVPMFILSRLRHCVKFNYKCLH